MSRLLSNVPPKKLSPKDDFNVYYDKGISITEVNDILYEDDWNIIYNDPTPMLPDEVFLTPKFQMDYFYEQYEEYCRSLPQMAIGISLTPFCFNKEMPNKNSKSDFGNTHSEVEFVRRVLMEFGLPDEKKMEIDRIITQVKVDMKQDEMNKKFESK